MIFSNEHFSDKKYFYEQIISTGESSEKYRSHNFVL